MQLDNCATFACLDPVEYHAVDAAGRTVAGYCQTHGDAIMETGSPHYILIRPEPSALLPPSPQEIDPMADTQPPIQTEMAPPDAIFDEEDKTAPVSVRTGPTTEEASTNFFWRLGSHHLFDLQTTVRGTPTEPQMRNHLKAVVDTLKSIVALGGAAKNVGPGTLRPAPPPTATPPMATPEAPATPAGNGTAATAGPAATSSPLPIPPAPAPATPGPATPAPAAPGPQGPRVLHATKLQIVPRPDGKTQLDFFLDHERRYSDLRLVDTPDNALRFLSRVGQWTAEHLRGAGTYPVNYDVMWEESTRLNSKGNPYKDIVGIALHA